MKLRTPFITLATFVAVLTANVLVSSHVGAIGNIGGRPATPDPANSRSQSIFIHTIKKGQTVDDKVLVSNQTDSKQTIELYAVDAIPSNTGAFTCKQRSEKATDAGAWIKLSTTEVTLKANDSTIVPFTISAPKDADVGEHDACLAFEAKNEEPEISGNLRITTRSAVRVALTIPGKLRREVAVASYTIDQKNYQQRYTLDLKNVGNVSADTNVDVELRTLFGSKVYQNGGEYPVLANKALELSYENDKSPFFGGWYFAEASASYDKDASTWGTQKTKDLATVYAHSKLVFIWPQPLAMVIIIVVVAALVWLIIWLLRQEKLRLEILESWKPHKIKKGDTIQALAESANVSWKRLAKINKIKAPYTLVEKQTIYIPRKQNSKKKE